jgi:hypothetical protein
LDKRRSKKGRKAFTLLEVLLSAAIGVLLLAALYVAMQVQLDHAQAGREAVEQSLLARAILRRMSNDITPNLPSPPPPVASTGGGMGAGGGGSAGGVAAVSNASGTNSTTGNTTTGNNSSMTSSNNSTNSNSSAGSPVPVLNLQGDSEWMILWVSRISGDLSPLLTNQPVTSDLHQVTYWLAGGDSNPLGLARQEIKQATNENSLATAPPNIPDEQNYVIAEEVQGVTFRYFDGTAWQNSWDGTQTSGTSTTPIGPPIAVEITLTVKIPGSQAQGQNDTENNPMVKTYRHVVAIPTANGATPSTGTTSTTTSSTPTGQ